MAGHMTTANGGLYMEIGMKEAAMSDQRRNGTGRPRRSETFVNAGRRTRCILPPRFDLAAQNRYSILSREGLAWMIQHRGAIHTIFTPHTRRRTSCAISVPFPHLATPCLGHGSKHPGNLLFCGAFLSSWEWNEAANTPLGRLRGSAGCSAVKTFCQLIRTLDPSASRGPKRWVRARCAARGSELTNSP